MRRKDLIRRLERLGCVLVRHGGAHDWYTNPTTRQSPPVHRHTEVNEWLARSILRKLGATDDED